MTTFIKANDDDDDELPHPTKSTHVHTTTGLRKLIG